MNLIKLYRQTPVARHEDVRVVGDRVFVRDTNGDVTEYFILEGGELWLIRSDKQLKTDVAAIKTKVGA